MNYKVKFQISNKIKLKIKHNFLQINIIQEKLIKNQYMDK